MRISSGNKRRCTMVALFRVALEDGTSSLNYPLSWFSGATITEDRKDHALRSLQTLLGSERVSSIR